MRRLEEQVSCKDDKGNTYQVEVFRNLERETDGSQTIGTREAFLAGNKDTPVKVFDDQNTFQTRDGTILRRVTGRA